ncbi:unnamed protein product [Prorocentrum cordatum]|uniref:Uncharacterized protein n=1 Tax=Prorocentrum cordatum TaxID=2364126 RepID=A0ABN9QK05_9DINO|nr:unnamed protein product [Polarella glacialis]
MARLTLAITATLALSASAAVRANATIDINQMVTIDGTQVFSQGSGHDSLNQCAQFARAAVNDPARPSIEVCGTSTKVTVFLRNRCKGYHHYTEEIGTCNAGAPSTSCVTVSPATVGWLQTAQSYMITQC